MKRLLLFLIGLSLYAQVSAPDRIRNVVVAPTVGAACVTTQAMQRDVSGGATSGHLFSCEAGLWVDISGTGAGGGDVSSNTASSVDSEVALFSGTAGKTIKRASGTGLGLLTSGVLSALDPSGCAANTFYSDINTAGTITCSGSPFSVAGTFDNTAMTLPLQGVINSASALTDFQAAQGSSNYSAIGVAGSVKVPSNSTNHEADGVFGSCTGTNATTNCTGGMFYGIAGADGTNGASDANRNRLWGINPLATDKGFSHIFMTNEMDFNVTGTDTKVIGWQFSGASTQAVTSDSVGIAIGPIGSGIGWPVGFYCAQGSITATGQCVKIDPTSSSNNVSSNTLQFLSRTSGGTLNTVDVSAGAGGGLNFSLSAGAGYTFKNNAGTTIFVINGGGSETQTGLALAGLAPTTNGTFVYCTDCLPNSVPCTASSTGAFAKRLNGAWRCD